MTKKVKILAHVAGFLIGASGGFLLVILTPWDNWINVLLGFTVLITGFILHVFIHELGHMVAGMMSGYGFVSIRFFNLTIIKKDGKLMRKNYKIAGTLGQCLMSPPEPVDGKYPFVLYNLGGGLMNFVFSAVFLALYFVFAPFTYAWIFIMLACIGVFLGLLNLIPLNLGIPNDGHNALTLGKDELSRHALWTILNAAALMTKGVRHRDIPIEQLFFDDDKLLKKDNNALVLNVANIRFEQLFDRQEFDKAKTFAETLLATAEKMIEIQKNELRCELLFFELIGECRKAEIERLYDKNLKKYVKATSGYPARQRLLYTYAKLFLNDEAKAAKILSKFDKTCQSHPFEGEIIQNRELMKNEE